MFPSVRDSPEKPDIPKTCGNISDEPWLKSSTYSAIPQPSLTSNKEPGKVIHSSKRRHDDRYSNRRDSERCVSEPPSKKPSSKNMAVFLEDIPGLSISDAFRLDRTFNREIYTFGSIYENHVSKFHVSPKTVIVGFKNLRLCDLLDTSENHVKKGVKKSRYFSKHSRAALSKPPQIISSSQATSENSEFLTLTPTFPYPITSSPAPNTTLNHCETLNRRVYDKPTDLRSWLELIDMQAKEAAYLHLSEPSSKDSESAAVPLKMTSRDRLLILKKQAAMADRALAANPGSLCLKILTIKLSELAAELESHGVLAPTNVSTDLFQPERIGRDWAQLVFTYPQLVSVWRGYIAHLMGKYAAPPSATQTIGSGLFTRIDAVYKRALSTLSGIISGRILSHRSQSDTAEQTIDLLADYCQWLVQAGHAERALALWQAVIEFNCFRPSELSQSPTDQCMLEMELYWSSGAARFGQPGSEHWSGWYRSNRHSSKSTDRSRARDTRTDKKPKKSPSGLYPLEELNADATLEQLQSKWSEVSGNLKAIASTCEDALIWCSANTLLDEGQQKLDAEIVPPVLSSAVITDQWVRRGAVPSLTGRAPLGKSRAVLYRRGKAWVGLERAREAVGWLPSDALVNQSEAAEEEEDPERLVLFDDVKACMLELLNTSEKDASVEPDIKRCRVISLQQRLLLHCLDFLGAYDANVAAQHQLPADLRLMHDLGLVGPIQRQNLSPVASQHLLPATVEGMAAKDHFSSMQRGHQDVWVRARRCFLDAALTQASHIPQWSREVQTHWLACLGRLRFQVMLDRLLDGIKTHELTAKTIISTWRHCGRSIMAQAQNQQDLELWQAYAMGFWRAGLILIAQNTDPCDVESLVTESRRIFDAALTTYPIPSDSICSSLNRSSAGSSDSFIPTLAARLRLLRQYLDLELGVHPGSGGTKTQVGSEPRAIRLLIYAVTGGDYAVPNVTDALWPSTLVRTSHAYGKCMESIWSLLVALPDDTKLESSIHGPLLDNLSMLAPTVAYLSLMFDLLTTDEHSMDTTVPSLLPVLERLDRFRSVLFSAPTRHSRWSEAQKGSADWSSRICIRQFLILVIGGLSAFSALRQRNRRLLLRGFFQRCAARMRLTAAEFPSDIVLPSQLAYLLPPRIALDKTQFPLTLTNASSCHGLLPPLFLANLIQQLNHFAHQVADIAAEMTVDRIVSGPRITTSAPTLIQANKSGVLDLFLPPSYQLNLYSACLPVALDLFILSLELDRWTSLLACASDCASGGMPATDSTSSQRVRNAFERAVRAGSFVAPMVTEDGALYHIALAANTPSFWSAHLRLVIWRAYMAFGWMSGTSYLGSSTSRSNADPRQRRQALKAVFYRAIEDLPWAKVLYTDLIRYCPEDVEEVVDLLSERELRLRTPLEEVDLLLTAKPVGE